MSPIVAAVLQAVQLTMADPGTAPLPYPAIGVGTWAWGNRFLWGYDPAQDAELEATFRLALDLGLTFFDTADSYGTGRWTGRSEMLLGRFCSALGPDQRRRLQVATKLAPFPWRLGRHGFRRAFEASARRLNGHLRRVQLHWSTARYAPWQEGPLLDGLADLVLAGDVAELGVSNMGPRRLRQVVNHLARRGVRLTSLQVQLSLLSPEPIAAGGVADVCRELGVELIAYSPLALGLLARSGDASLPMPRGPRAVLFRRLEPQLASLRERMGSIAAAHGAPLSAVALNWCRAHGALPIVGLRSEAQAEMAAGALQWRLSLQDRQGLDAMALELPQRMPANPFQSA
jgi:pyridoxine 4-dehydrogenase